MKLLFDVKLLYVYLSGTTCKVNFSFFLLLVLSAQVKLSNVLSLFNYRYVVSFYQFVDHVGDGASVLGVEGGVDLVEKVERGRVAFLQTAWG